MIELKENLILFETSLNNNLINLIKEKDYHVELISKTIRMDFFFIKYKGRSINGDVIFSINDYHFDRIFDKYSSNNFTLKEDIDEIFISRQRKMKKSDKDLLKRLVKLDNINEYVKLTKSYTDKSFLIGKNDKIKKI